jgi:DNA-binding MarR family transcriptional regulator
MVTTVDDLERAGLAERRPSATDRRARIIAVTPAGRKLVAKSAAIVHDTYEQVLSSLPAGQRQAFLDGLCQIVSGCLAQPAQCQKPPRRPRGS